MVRTRKIFERFPLIGALKAVTARFGDNAQWTRLRPPLVELDQQQRGELFALLDELGFDMPGLKQS